MIFFYSFNEIKENKDCFCMLTLYYTYLWIFNIFLLQGPIGVCQSQVNVFHLPPPPPSSNLAMQKPEHFSFKSRIKDKGLKISFPLNAPYYYMYILYTL